MNQLSEKRLEKEYCDLNSSTVCLIRRNNYTTNEAIKKENWPRNRYRDILPCNVMFLIEFILSDLFFVCGMFDLIQLF